MDDYDKLDVVSITFDVLQSQANPWHNGHQSRCAQLCVKFAKRLRNDLEYKDFITDKFIEDLKWGARLHDIGKALIPDLLINKPGRLTNGEWLAIKAHPENAKALLIKLDIQNKGVLDTVLCHQERWDGTGYPLGLNGLDIPLSARILKIVDTLDAMTNDRPYRQVYSVSHALIEMGKDNGLDPSLFKHFLEMMKE
jgi:HD-GYP domain-containing protein (c-di-GMP phosphodiesterase class II)